MCVYPVCMARVNVYLPDGLARRAREAGLNVSGIAQEALERELSIRDTNSWLDSLADGRPVLKVSDREMRAIWEELDEDEERRAERVVDRLRDPGDA